VHTLSQLFEQSQSALKSDSIPPNPARTRTKCCKAHASRKPHAETRFSFQSDALDAWNLRIQQKIG